MLVTRCVPCGGNLGRIIAVLSGITRKTKPGVRVPSLNPFRVSFDGPIRPRERRQAIAMAIVVGCAALALGTTGLMSVLDASSELIASLSNARSEPQQRSAANEPSGKPCEEQIWPDIEAHCLTGRNPNPTGQVAASPPAGAQMPTLQAAASADRSTTGTAPRDESPGPDRTAAVPIPVPAPEAVASARSDAAPAGEEAKPRLANREQIRAQRERREAARRLRAERQRERAEARRLARRGLEDERMEQQWSGYGYASPPFAPSQRGSVIRRGSLDDIFPTFR